jgi:hypothetical protein
LSLLKLLELVLPLLVLVPLLALVLVPERSAY